MQPTKEQISRLKAYYKRKAERLHLRYGKEQDTVERYKIRRAIRLTEKSLSDLSTQFTEDKGNANSGNHNHAGRPGKVGGSAPQPGSKAQKDHTLRNYDKKISKKAQHEYNKMRQREPKISEDMQKISSSIGCKLSGIQYSVKTAKSIVNKLERKRAYFQKREMYVPDEYIIRGMGDVVRYTEIGKNSELADITRKTIKALEKNGYEIVELDNKWIDGKSAYKGIHLGVVSPTGQKFEYQIHSKESLRIKDKLHKLYEEERDVKTPLAKKLQLRDEQKEIAKKYKYPKGIETLKSFKKE